MRSRMCKLPAILKTRRFGYDGKGQALVRSEAEARCGVAKNSAAARVLERLVDVRARDIGHRRARPKRRDAVLRSGRERAPERHPRHQPRACPHPRRCAPTRRGASPARSPRRSTMSACSASRCFTCGRRGPRPPRQRDRAPRAQFRPLDPRRLPRQPVREPYPRHRRLAAWRHGAPQRRGDDQPDRRRCEPLARACGREDLALHLYGKAEARPGRKMGHHDPASYPRRGSVRMRTSW